MPRLLTGAAPWIEPEAMLEAARDWVEESLRGVVFVAEDAGRIVGFVTVAEKKHFTGGHEAYAGRQRRVRAFYARLGYKETDVRPSKPVT